MLWEEAIPFARDQLLPAARRTLGADSNITLKLNQNLAEVLVSTPERTRDDLLEADAILQDVVQRRRRAFGPAHPDTRFAEDRLSRMRAFFAQLRFA